MSRFNVSAFWLYLRGFPTRDDGRKPPSIGPRESDYGVRHGGSERRWHAAANK